MYFRIKIKFWNNIIMQIYETQFNYSANFYYNVPLIKTFAA